jgi:hypothetical protein
MLIDKELALNHDFAIENPEEVLPPQEDLFVDIQLPKCRSGLKSIFGEGGSQKCDQIADPESRISRTPWTLVCNKKFKNKSNDRRALAY